MKIFSLKINTYYYNSFLDEITKHIVSGTGGKAIFTPNPEICLKTLEDREFLEVLQQADYLSSDGIGLYLAYQINDILQPHFSIWGRIVGGLLFPYFLFNILFRKKYLYHKYGDRICGSDLTSFLVEYAQEEGIKIAILDPYRPDDAGKCAAQAVFQKKLQECFPTLDFEFYIYSEDTATEIFTKIQSSNAKILFSTLGMKSQEISVMRAIKSCSNIRLGLGIGSSFDYYTGFQKRAPKIWRNLGFEWLYRIFTSPRKLQRLGRIFQALVVFPLKVLLYK